MILLLLLFCREKSNGIEWNGDHPCYYMVRAMYVSIDESIDRWSSRMEEDGQEYYLAPRAKNPRYHLSNSFQTNVTRRDGIQLIDMVDMLLIHSFIS